MEFVFSFSFTSVLMRQDVCSLEQGLQPRSRLDSYHPSRSLTSQKPGVHFFDDDIWKRWFPVLWERYSHVAKLWETYLAFEKIYIHFKETEKEVIIASFLKYRFKKREEGGISSLIFNRKIQASYLKFFFALIVFFSF